MKKIIRLTGICYLFIIIILGQTSLLTVYATEQSKDGKETKIYDIDASAHTDDDELTQGFYLPKSSFRSDESYQDYCKQMYNFGYMDKNGNWTASAKNFINNQTSENMKALDDNAKEVVEQRIEKGEMSFEDSPYLTSEEKQKMEKEEAKEVTQQSDGTGTKDNDSLLDNDDSDGSSDSESDTTSSDYEDESDIDADEEDDSIEEPAQQKKGSLFGKIVMAILICGIAIVSYSIYRRQF